MFFISLSFAQITKNPSPLSLENLERTYTSKTVSDGTQEYVIERPYRYNSQEYNNGLAFYFPDFLKSASFAISPLIVSTNLDLYVSKYVSNAPIDIASPITAYNCFQSDKEPYGDACILHHISTNQTLFYPPSPSITLRVKSFPEAIKNHWIYYYPKTKREFIDKKNGTIFQYPQPIGATYNYHFDKEKVDIFVQSNPSTVAPYQSKCSNTLTYFQDVKYDRLIRKIRTQIQDSNLQVKKASSFNTFEEIEAYINDLNATLSHKNSTVKITLQSLYYLLEGTKTRKETTKNLCLYINYITNTPEYKSLDKATIINSQGKPGTIEDLYKFFKKINGYVLNGRYVKLNGKSYFIDWSDNIYDITQECKAIPSHKITSSSSKNLILHGLQDQPRSQYLIFMDDWDNDADDSMDCLRYTPYSNSLAKAELDENKTVVFKDLDMSRIGTIERSDNIIYFNKSAINSSQSSSSVSSYTGSSSSSFHSYSSYSSSYHPSSSAINHSNATSLIEDLGGNSGFSTSYNPQPIDMDHSSSSSSVSSYSSTPSSNIQNIVTRLANHSFPINGYFAHYDKNDTFGWVYLTTSGRTFAKLEGMDPQTGYLKWLLLQNYFSSVKFENGNIVVGEVKSTPSSNIQNIVTRLANHSFPINGYFAHYDKNDTFGWVYLTTSGRTFAKLEGMDPQTGYLKWLLLQNYFSSVKFENGNIVVGEVK